MIFGGLQKTSLIDFPDRISSILFTVGCNLRCPFCHNWRLILNPKPPFLSEDEALKILLKRKKYVDAVVITGGEPAMNRDLPKFVRRLKENGFSVKLDTNGFYPETLRKCLPYLDYIAMDVKTSLEKYKLLGAKDTDKLLHSIKIVKEGEVDYEFRNTVVPGIVDEEDIPKIGRVVEGAKRFVFQQFRPGETLDKAFNNVKPYPEGLIVSFSKIMKKYVSEVILRI
ncbi:anaerobic ribonucleoside-triphosphate reductase activating protein [Candidatus Bathyarchaeota archaeon]|nr:MAG: anaerobic ribonucleoside-triphosphate reductase activating protein [Candidatus Bathyarchaeota archaeon]